MVNHIWGEFSKLTQKKYKSRHDWLEKVIHEELCKRLKFDHTTKRYIDKAESVFKIETHKILMDFDPLIMGRRSGLELIKKKKRNFRLVGFAVTTEH